MKRLVLLAGLAAATYASASGYDPSNYTFYKAYTAPAIAPERFQAGQLGVLQPGMQRVYLYTAWRAMLLGPKVKTAAGRAGGLARANGSVFGMGGGSDPSSHETKETWLRETRRKESNFEACPEASTAFALATLKTARQRKDATPARLAAWIDAQELVSNACKMAQDARYGDENALDDVPIPGPLSDKEAPYWRQLRDYQRAAAMFYAEQYLDAAPLFDQIGASADHPMRDLGGYLALRSHVRHAAIPDPQVKDAAARYAALSKRGQAILADASLAARHEATRATLRSIRAHLLPDTVFAELNKQLADPAADAFADDRLGDWIVIMRQGDELPEGGMVRLKPAREKYDFISWIETLHDCAYRGGDKDKSCSGPAQRAQAQWERSKSRPWLAAALMLSPSLKPALETAALAVKPGDPDYLTVRYHLARLYRVGGRSTEARAISDAVLKLDLDHGSRNLLREERFAVATSIADAAAYMLRVDVDSSRDGQLVQGFNDDALGLMLHGLSAADMVALARQASLAPDTRARLASAAWMRAELLGKRDIALQSLDVLEPLVPALKADTAAYRAAKTPADQRHLMLLAALRFGLSPQMSESSQPVKPLAKEEIVASSWCRIKPAESAGGRPTEFPWLLPPVPALGDKVTAGAELGKLATFKAATGFVGDHVLARMQSNPADPDLPWLLHMVVKSTRGGCLDADAKKLSRDAFNALHKRFPGNEWTKKTPYFY